MRACPPGAVGARESRTGVHGALALPARVLRLRDARRLQRTFLLSGRAEHRVSAGPVVEDRRGLGSGTASPAVVRLFLEGAVQVSDHYPSRNRALPDPAEPRVTAARPLLLAALRGGLCVSSAF